MKMRSNIGNKTDLFRDQFYSFRTRMKNKNRKDKQQRERESTRVYMREREREREQDTYLHSRYALYPGVHYAHGIQLHLAARR